MIRHIVLYRLKESAAGRLATWNNLAQTGECSHSTVKDPVE